MSELAPTQQEALLGMIYDDFVVKNGARHLDYDKVRRYAFSMQIDDEICAVLAAEACAESVAWAPDDDWITQTCLAFRETKVQMEVAAKRADGLG